MKPSSIGDSIFRFTVTFAEQSAPYEISQVEEVRSKARQWWQDYWENEAFLTLPITSNSSAKELQRRIILSQYLLAVNGAGKDPAQDSGLVNNGWYGKFHLEMSSVTWLTGRPGTNGRSTTAVSVSTNDFYLQALSVRRSRVMKVLDWAK